MEMSSLFPFLAVGLALVSTVFSRATPPELVSSHGKTWSQSYDYIRPKSNSTYKCMATGNPTPKYIWTFNGTEVINNYLTVSYDSTTGILKTHERFGFVNSGAYQCIAINENGKAMSAFLNLMATYSDTFPGKETTPRNEDTYVSEYFSIICKDAPNSIPPLAFKWERKFLTSSDKNYKEISANDSRMITDDEGTLHFLWVVKSDGDQIYRCSGVNNVVLMETQNPATVRLTVQDAGISSDRAPELRFSQGAMVRAGEDAVLTCIFSYYSKSGENLMITWYHKGEKLEGKTGPKLLLEKVEMPTETKSLEGEYLCEGRIGDKKAEGTVELKVIGPPQFIYGQETSKDSVPLGDDAVFTCGTTSRHSHGQAPTWLINAEPLIGCLPGMFECKTLLSSGRSQCIPRKEICNADANCLDASDELKCPGACNEGMKDCHGLCIEQDEACLPIICDYPSFRCDNDEVCIPESKLCDGFGDCDDGSDERACAGRGNHTIDRFVVNSARTKLILPNVMLDDTMCIQCMVSNDFGTTMGDGCLTVIDKIKLIVKPNATYNVKPGLNLSIPIQAQTDPLYQNQMKYKWVWFNSVTNPANGQVIEREEQLPPMSLKKYFRLSLANTNLTIEFPKVEGESQNVYKDYNTMKDRNYAVIISHLYDEVTYKFYIEGEDAVPPTGAPVVETASLNLWFIWVILAVALLVVVIVLVVCYLYRNRGGTYMLGKKEKKAGHNPEEELMNDGFHDAGRQFAEQEDPEEPY